jgi:hypothetical protein
MNIVWLSGLAGSGKDTVASILTKKYDYYRVAFADVLKDMVAAAYDIDRKLCDTVEGKQTLLPNGKTVREVLIYESAEAKKGNSNVFAEQALIKILESNQNHIVISDWRYPEEYEFIKINLGPDVTHNTIRIVRPGLPSLLDPSEHALDSWSFDTTITNTQLKFLERDIVAYLSQTETYGQPGKNQ